MNKSFGKLLFTVGPVGPIAMNLLSFAYLNRHIVDEENIRNLIVLTALSQVIGMGLAFGSPATFTKNYFSNCKKLQAFRIVWLVLLAVTVLSVLSLFTAGVAAYLSWGSGLLAALVAVNSSSVAAAIIYQSVCRAKRKSGTFLLLTLITAASNPILCVLAKVGAGKEGLIVLFAAVFATSLLINVVGMVATASEVGAVDLRRSLYSTGAALKDLARTGLPTLPHSLALSGLPAFMRLVSGVASPGYAVSMHSSIQVGGATITFLGTVNNSWSIDTYERPIEDTVSYIRKSLGHFFILGGTVCLGCWLLTPFAIELLLGSTRDPQSAIDAAYVLAISSLMFPVYLAHVNYAIRRGIVSQLAYFTPLMLAISACVSFSLFRLLGSLSGLAACSPIFYCLITVTLAINIWRAENKLLLPVVMYVKIASVFVLAVVVALGLVIADFSLAPEFALVFVACIALLGLHLLLRMSREEFYQVM